jgi:hypothetical protein
MSHHLYSIERLAASLVFCVSSSIDDTTLYPCIIYPFLSLLSTLPASTVPSLFDRAGEEAFALESTLLSLEATVIELITNFHTFYPI